MKNVKKAILLLTVIVTPLLFTACEEEFVFDTETPTKSSDYDVEESEDIID